VSPVPIRDVFVNPATRAFDCLRCGTVYADPGEVQQRGLADAEAAAAIACSRREPVPDWARELLATDTAKLIARALGRPEPSLFGRRRFGAAPGWMMELVERSAMSVSAMEAGFLAADRVRKVEEVERPA
jgi:hypothetical protein